MKLIIVNVKEDKHHAQLRLFRWIDTQTCVYFTWHVQTRFTNSYSHSPLKGGVHLHSQFD